FKDCDRLPLRPNHPDVACRSLHRPAQHAHIVAMPTSDDHDVRRLAGRKLRRRLVEIVSDYLLRLGESFPARIGFAIVDHRDVESGNARHLIEAGCHMTCTENVKIRWRQNRLNKNLEGSATDQAGVVLRILVQIKSQSAWLLR